MAIGFRAVIVVVSLTAILAGCGFSTYEDRLAKTDQRNRYLARLDATLDPYGNSLGYGIWLRAPKGMRSLPAPVKPKEGEMPPDLRQEFEGVALELPGIIHCYEATLPTAGGETGTYRVYLLGNHSRFGRKEESFANSNDPVQFFGELEVALQSLFGVTIPEGDRGRGDQNNVKYRLQIPASDQYAVSKSFKSINFVPEEAGRTPFHAWLLEHTTGQIQVAVLMLTPPNPSTEVRQSLTTALETLQVSPDTPGLQGGAASGPVSGF